MPANTVVEPKRDSLPVVRSAGPEDHPAIREVVAAAYQQYADELGPQVFPRYLADLLDLDRHAHHGHLLVAEVDGRIRGSGAFYPDSSVQGLGWPPGWAGGRALAVHPAARGRGIAGTLLDACERLARSHGAPVFAFHTGSFMAGAILLYEQLGYHRAPEFDLNLNAHYGVAGAAPAIAVAYLRRLTAARHDHVRRTHCGASTAQHTVGLDVGNRPASSTAP
jgi:GNAT superfamily N-acetyltransferase